MTGLEIVGACAFVALVLIIGSGLYANRAKA
jgi:hypothetical protein